MCFCFRPVILSILFIFQEGNLQDHEEFLPTRSQHGLVLLRQQDHPLRHLHPLRAAGKPHFSQPRVRDRVAVHGRAPHCHALLPRRRREAVREPRQRPEDSGMEFKLFCVRVICR